MFATLRHTASGDAPIHVDASTEWPCWMDIVVCLRQQLFGPDSGRGSMVRRYPQPRHRCTTMATFSCAWWPSMWATALAASLNAVDLVDDHLDVARLEQRGGSSEVLAVHHTGHELYACGASSHEGRLRKSPVTSRLEAEGSRPEPRALTAYGCCRRSHMMTALTRRSRVASGGRSSLVKMLLTCVSAVRWLTARSSPIAVFE